MKQIPLRGKHGIGKFAQVDTEDYEYLMQWKWFTIISKSGKTYAFSTIAKAYDEAALKYYGSHAHVNFK